MKVAIVGSRTYPDLELVREFVRTLEAGTTVVSGGATGVDTAAEEEAKLLGLPTLIYKPDWKRHGQYAGYVRNKDIVAAADRVVAFWDGRSRGTKSSIDIATEMRKRCTVVLPPIVATGKVELEMPVAKPSPDGSTSA